VQLLMYAAVAAMPCYVAPSSPVLKVAATGMPQRCNGPFCTHVNRYHLASEASSKAAVKEQTMQVAEACKPVRSTQP